MVEKGIAIYIIQSMAPVEVDKYIIMITTTILPARKRIFHRNSGQELNRTASPKRMRMAPMIMGFRTYRYGPMMTSFWGGSQGAGVPSPDWVNSLAVRKAR